MKVYEITLTELNTADKHRLAYQSGKAKMAARAGTLHYDSKKGLVRYDAKGRAIPIKPIDALKMISISAYTKTNAAILKGTQQFYNLPFVKLVGHTSAVVVPIAQWIEEMAAIRELWNIGAFGKYDNGQEIVKDLREYYTLIAFSRILSGVGALAILIKTTPTSVAVLAKIFRFIPGFGSIIALGGTLAIQAGLLYLLNKESVQKYLATTLLSWAAPAAGIVGDQIGGFIPADWKNARRDVYKAVKDYVSDAGDAEPASTEQPDSTPRPVRTGSVTAQDLIKQYV